MRTRDELRALAQAATVGPWRAECDGGMGQRLDIVYVLGPARELLAVTQTADEASEGDDPIADAAFIAACDPPTVLALLDALGVAEAALARVKAAHSKLHGRCDNPICPLRAALVPTPDPPAMSERAANALADLILADADMRGDAPVSEQPKEQQ